MRSNDIKQLHNLEVSELQAKFVELRAAFDKTRIDSVLGTLKNVKIMQSLRRDMARVLTVLRKRELSS